DLLQLANPFALHDRTLKIRRGSVPASRVCILVRKSEPGFYSSKRDGTRRAALVYRPPNAPHNEPICPKRPPTRQENYHCDNELISRTRTGQHIHLRHNAEIKEEKTPDHQADHPYRGNRHTANLPQPKPNQPPRPATKLRPPNPAKNRPAQNSRETNPPNFV